MDSLDYLLEQNKIWAQEVKRSDPAFFEKLSVLQEPRFLWICCSDSRMITATSVGLMPGEMFVHRNIANLVIHADLNCLAVIQFAVDVLKVRHVIVCGHYGCGGVAAAFRDTRTGLVDNWLRHVQNLIRQFEPELSRAASEGERLDRLCEINVIEQVINVAETTIVQDAWRRGQDLQIHGWIYRVSDGLYRNLRVSLESSEELEEMRLKATTQGHQIGIGK